MGNSCVKVRDHSKLTTPPDVSEYHTADGAINGQADEPSSTSSSSIYLSAHDGVQSTHHSRTESNSGLEREIEASKVHWSQLSTTSCDSLDGSGESNREIYERLRQLPQYQHWLNVETDLHSPNDIVLGPKLAEGGQAEIFEIEYCHKIVHLPYVLKVFKQGYSLQDLQLQWPKGILSARTGHDLVRGGLVLQDDRFAFLLHRKRIDLRKLIDVAQEESSPLWRELGPSAGSFEQFRTYEPQARRHGCSAPVFKEQSALKMMNCIALQMFLLHDADILHRDLKASNVLCSDHYGGTIAVQVADYESSVGVVGTGFWRAPEILQQLKDGKRRVHFTCEADVYSYAMTCYEILTGCIPFQGSGVGVYEHVLNGVRPALPDYVPAWVKDLIHRCWHQDASERPTFSAILAELKSRGVSLARGRGFMTLERPD